MPFTSPLKTAILLAPFELMTKTLEKFKIDLNWNSSNSEALRKSTYEGMAQYHLLKNPVENTRKLAILEYAVQRYKNNPTLNKDDLVKEIKLGEKQINKMGFVAGSEVYDNFERDMNVTYEVIGDALSLFPSFQGKPYTEVGYKWLVRGLKSYTEASQADPNVIWQSNAERLEGMSSGIVDDAYELALQNPDFADVVHHQFRNLFPARITPISSPDAIINASPDYADHININALKEAMASENGVDKAFVEEQFQKVMGEMQAINKDNTEYLKGIKGLILQQKAEEAESRAHLKKAENYQEKIDGARAACNFLGTLAGWIGEPKLAKTISVGGNAIITMVDAVNKIGQVANATNSFSKVMNIVSNLGNIVGAIGGIVSLFTGSGPSEFDMVSEQIQSMHKEMREGFGKISEQIGKMHEDMIKGFEGLSQQMADFERNMVNQFKWVQESLAGINKRLDAVIDLSLLQLDRLSDLSDNIIIAGMRLSEIQRDLDTVGRDVSQIKYYLIKGFQDQTMNQLKLSADVQLCLNEKKIMNRNSITMNQDKFNLCIMPLANMALDVVKNDIVFNKAFTRAELEPDMATTTLGGHSPLESLSESLSFYLGADIQLSANHALAWSRSVNMYLDLHDTWPEYSSQMKKEVLAEHVNTMRKDGTNIESTLRSAYFFITNDDYFIPNRVPFGRLLDIYNVTMNELKNNLDTEFTNFCQKNKHSVSGVRFSDLISSEDKTVDTWARSVVGETYKPSAHREVCRDLLRRLAYEYVASDVLPETKRLESTLSYTLKKANGVKTLLHSFIRLGFGDGMGPNPLYSGDEIATMVFSRFSEENHAYFGNHPLKDVAAQDLIKGLSNNDTTTKWQKQVSDYNKKNGFNSKALNYLASSEYTKIVSDSFNHLFTLLDEDCESYQQGQEAKHFRVPTYLRLTNKRLNAFRALHLH